MKCPKCSVDLLPTIRHKIKVNYCQSCKGMWSQVPRMHRPPPEVQVQVLQSGDGVLSEPTWLLAG